MRALVHNGRHFVRVKVPVWVTFTPLEVGVFLSRCKRCGSDERVETDRKTAESCMGRFALFHDRCIDPKDRRPRLIAAPERYVDPGVTYCVPSKAT